MSRAHKARQVLLEGADHLRRVENIVREANSNGTL